ncbi:MAG: hypothetical protein REI94_00720 [Moraxellaceae bacterium]|nr:hypothetical protein [Moraxellaceae bacterium]
MNDLANSRRRLYKTTYAPIELDNESPRRTGRGMQKAACAAAFGMRPAEGVRVQRQLEGKNDEAGLKVLNVLKNMAAEGSAAVSVRHAPELAGLDAEALVRVGKLLVGVRKEVAGQVEGLIGSLREAYRNWLLNPSATSSTSTPTTTTPPRATTATATARAVPDGAKVDVSEATTADGTTVRTVVQRTEGGSRGALLIDIEPIEDTQQTPGGAVQAVVRAPVASIEEAIAWAAKHEPTKYAQLKQIAAEYSPLSLAYTNLDTAQAISWMLPKVVGNAAQTESTIKGFQQQLTVEPVGRLHLERLQMTPVGVERGELVYSIPLTPKETVNITHREWSVTTKEFESIVQDQFEGFSETGVSEKTDIAQSTENQRRHSSALSFNANANASYLGVTLSSSVGYDSSSDDQTSQRDSRNHTIDATRRASARTRKDHKTSFKVSSVVGTEDSSVRVITNPSDTQPMRVDYYNMMRKWRVDLFRYGLRMTYDLTIPSPGSDLIRKLESLAEVEQKIAQPFSFPLKVSDVTRDNWTQLAGQYQASVEAPPLATQLLKAGVVIQKPVEENEKTFVGAIDFHVDDDYTLASGSVACGYWYEDIAEDGLIFDVRFDTAKAVTSTLFDEYGSAKLNSSLIGRSGNLSLPYFHRGITSAHIDLLYRVSLRAEVYQAWQSRAWMALRDAAEALHQRRAQSLQDERSNLLVSLAPFDSLTLRRMEQEEIMKGVMRWLFGPQFKLTPPDIEWILNHMNGNDPYANDALDPSSLNHGQWSRMLEFGEFIKFVQHAIEWENVLYFNYPYFWDMPKNWTLKQFLEHPDALHRAFLRAGAARVVLTIRPGFEKSFAALIDSGAFGKLYGDHPYVTIAEEIQNYAETNYPGIPPANPANPDHEDEVTKAEQGQLVATWWEYTPTSALDLSINTPYAELS